MRTNRERDEEEKKIMNKERSFSKNLLLPVALMLICIIGGRAHASKGVLCRWGARAEMEPVPDCGVPRTVEVNIPKGTFRLYFVRGDNPGLSGYYFLGRSSRSSPREIMNKVNVSAMSLMLCPPDFKEERVLAFQDVDQGEILKGRPTCRLGPPPDRDQEDDGSEKPLDDEVADDDEGIEESPQTVTGVVQPPEGEKGIASWKKIDRYARLLGVVAVGLGLICFVALVILALLFQKKIRKIESVFSSSAVLSTTNPESVMAEGAATQDEKEVEESLESQESQEEIIALENPVSRVEQPHADKKTGEE